MPKKLHESMNPKLESARKNGNLLYMQWMAPWSQECQSWIDELAESPEWLGLKNEFSCMDWNRDWSPELDQGLQAFVQDRAGSSGWPLNLFIDPDTSKIVFASPSVGVEDFVRIARQLAVAWKIDPTQLKAQAGEEFLNFTQKDPLKYIEGENYELAKANVLDEKILFRFLTPLEQSIDLTTGFVGQGKTFLYPELYNALLSHNELSKFGEMALVQLAKSPLYDVVGGGFFRSLEWDVNARNAAPEGSFDSKWVTHVSSEKLLIENSEMLSLYIDAFKTTNNPFFTQVAHEILELIVDTFNLPGSSLSLSSAVRAPESYYKIDGKDLLEAVRPQARQATQLFFGLNEGRDRPYLATDVKVLGEYIGEEPIDLRLKLTDARKELKAYREKKAELSKTGLKYCPPTRLSELTALKAMAHASFAFDTPKLNSLCETLIEKYQSEYNGEWSLREKASLLRAYTAMARLYTAQRDVERSNRMFAEAEKLIIELQDPLFLEAKVKTPFVGERMELCDHTGSSGFAIMLNGLMDFNALQKMGLKAEHNVPVDVEPALSWALEYVRPLGIYAASTYGAAMRYFSSLK